jgi:hypothetical protein
VVVSDNPGIFRPERVRDFCTRERTDLLHSVTVASEARFPKRRVSFKIEAGKPG